MPRWHGPLALVRSRSGSDPARVLFRLTECAADVSAVGFVFFRPLELGQG